MKSAERISEPSERVLKELVKENQDVRYFKELDREWLNQTIEVVLRDAGVNRSIF